MPFTILISINARDLVQIKCRNCGLADRGLTRYRYQAEYAQTRIEGEVFHRRAQGIEKLSAILLQDLSGKYNSFRDHDKAVTGQSMNSVAEDPPRLRDLPEGE